MSEQRANDSVKTVEVAAAGRRFGLPEASFVTGQHLGGSGGDACFGA